MRYGAIAEDLRKTTQKLTELAEKLEKIEAATPEVKINSNAKLASKLTLTVAEAAELLSVSKQTIYQLIHRDDFPSLTIGRRVLIAKDKLLEWVNNHCNELI